MTVQPKRAAPSPLHTQPSLDTPRLLLRPFEMHDAPTVQKLAGAFEVADTTLNIPHPYRDGAAEAWIMTHNQLGSISPPPPGSANARRRGCPRRVAGRHRVSCAC